MAWVRIFFLVTAVWSLQLVCASLRVIGGVSNTSVYMAPASVGALVANSTELYVGGAFLVAGGKAVNNTAKWNGSSWSPLGSGLFFPPFSVSSGGVLGLAVYGSDIFAGGNFRGAIAKWNGVGWVGAGYLRYNPAPPATMVSALAACGQSLFAAGNFDVAGNDRAYGLAKWNGVDWSAVGKGFYLPNGNAGSIAALAINGSELFVGGYFSKAGSVLAQNVARWNGTTWSALGWGLAYGHVDALAVNGTTLYAGGRFRTDDQATVIAVAKWNGSAWSAVGSGLPGGLGDKASRLAVLGSTLFAGGVFDAGGSYLAIWDGLSWSHVSNSTVSYITAIAASDNKVFVSGSFTTATVSTSGVAVFDLPSPQPPSQPSIQPASNGVVSSPLHAVFLTMAAAMWSIGRSDK